MGSLSVHDTIVMGEDNMQMQVVSVLSGRLCGGSVSSRLFSLFGKLSVGLMTLLVMSGHQVKEY